jgi:hypothetical protein
LKIKNGEAQLAELLSNLDSWREDLGFIQLDIKDKDEKFANLTLQLGGGDAEGGDDEGAVEGAVAGRVEKEVLVQDRPRRARVIRGDEHFYFYSH